MRLPSVFLLSLMSAPILALRSSRLPLECMLRWPRWMYAPCLLLLMLASVAALRAQTATAGALGGVVTDASGAAIAGADLRLESVATGAAQSLATDRLGEFLFPDLAPGTYRLDIRADGFGALQVVVVGVEIGRTTRLAPSLRVAVQTQAVEVLELDSLPGFEPPVNANLAPADLLALPLDGRRFQGLAALTPLVSAEDAAPADDAADSNGASDTGDPAPDTDNVRLSVRSLDPSHNQYALDGLSLTRAFDGEPRGGPTLPFTVAQEGVREFQVRAVGEGIALGRDAGGSVNTVTRRGEADVHGSAFFLLRNSGVGAANPFAISTRYNGGSPVTSQVKPRDQREQFGGSLGGPLLRTGLGAKVFGFVAAEGQRRSFPAISSPGDPNFYQLSPVVTALLANRGVTAAATAKALAFLDSLTGPVDRRADELALLPRVDWQPGSRTAVAVDWAHVRFQSPSGQRGAPVVARGRASLGDIAIHTDAVSLHATGALSTGWLGEVRAQWSRDAAFATVPAPLAAEPHTGPGGAAPEVSIAGAFVFGNAAALGARRLPEERRSEAAAQLSYNGRAHTISLGADVSGVDERIGSRDGSSGAYDYSSGTTAGRAGGLADFITDFTYSATSYPNGGCPSIYAAVHLFCFRGFAQSFGALPETRFHTVELSVFADDAWRPTTRLRLSAGVRYEYNRLPPPQHPNAALDAVLAVVANGSAATANMPADTNNLAPHLGLSYAPGQSTVVRLGYGIHFGGVPGRTLQAALENTSQPASQTRLRLTPRTVLDPACASAGTNFGYPATFACSPFGPLAADGAATVFARGFQMPMVQTGEISVTRQVARSTSLHASYVFGLNRQLANTTDLNIAPSTARGAFNIVRSGGGPGAGGSQVFNMPLYTARRSAAYGPVTAILSNGNGTYNTVALQLQQGMLHGLAARASWTYSKALDNVRTTGAVPNEDAQFDPFEPLYDRSASNFDRRHRVSVSMIWQPELHGSSRILRAVANGWSASPVVLATSGRPFSFRIDGGSSLPGGRQSINGSGGATYLPSTGRNTLRLPWTQNVDLRITRSIATGDGPHLRLSAEAFNLLNHVNVTAVEQRAFLAGTAVNGIVPLTFQDAATIASEGLTSRAFGTPTSSADSPARERRVQAGLRLEW